ncbi:MAG: hypothetical protein WCG95_07715 [bacterium]
MQNNEYLMQFSGFVAFCPQGKYISHSRTLSDLQDELEKMQVRHLYEYNDMLDEGGSWVCFIDYLLINGLKVYLATESVIQVCEGKSRSVGFEYCNESKRIWITGEIPPDAQLNAQDLYILIAEKIMGDEITRGLEVGW